VGSVTLARLMSPPHLATTAFAARELPGVNAGPDWLTLVGGLHGRPGFWWLDSALAGGPTGRFSFAGAEPYAVVQGSGSQSHIRWLRRPAGMSPGLPDAKQGDPLDALRAWLPPRPTSAPAFALPFVGGAVGAFGYELPGTFDRTPRTPGGASRLPDLCWLLVDRLYALDHREGRLWACALGFGASEPAASRRAEALAGELTRNLPAGAPPPGPGALCASQEPEVCFDAPSYAKAIGSIQERIVAGDVYQACLTQRLELPFPGDPFALYGALRALNPAPFAAYLQLPDVTVVGSSPERFLCLDGARRVESRPIKGTRPRRQEPEADRAEARALAHSEKDRAENLMIVDLVRNDLGRVCETGSIHVPELMVVEPYAAVFQLVSAVQGRLRPACDAFDLVRACFPPGSMTGAPKPAAMALLAHLERGHRGFYAGALGYLDLRGGCELSVVIRTLFLREGRAWLHTGGGIVADSDAGAEWCEAADKAAPLLDALARAPRAPADAPA